MGNIEGILGREETSNLKENFNALLDSEASFAEVEDLLLSYGLEMDYVEQLLF